HPPPLAREEPDQARHELGRLRRRVLASEIVAVRLRTARRVGGRLDRVEEVEPLAAGEIVEPVLLVPSAELGLDPLRFRVRHPSALHSNRIEVLVQELRRSVTPGGLGAGGVAARAGLTVAVAAEAPVWRAVDPRATALGQYSADDGRRHDPLVVVTE